MSVTCKCGNAANEVKLGPLEGWVAKSHCEKCGKNIGRSSIRYRCSTCQSSTCAMCAFRDTRAVSPTGTARQPFLSKSDSDPALRKKIPARSRSASPCGSRTGVPAAKRSSGSSAGLSHSQSRPARSESPANRQCCRKRLPITKDVCTPPSSPRKPVAHPHAARLVDPQTQRAVETPTRRRVRIALQQEVQMNQAGSMPPASTLPPSWLMSAPQEWAAESTHLPPRPEKAPGVTRTPVRQATPTQRSLPSSRGHRPCGTASHHTERLGWSAPQDEQMQRVQAKFTEKHGRDVSANVSLPSDTRLLAYTSDLPDAQRQRSQSPSLRSAMTRNMQGSEQKDSSMVLQQQLVPHDLPQLKSLHSPLASRQRSSSHAIRSAIPNAHRLTKGVTSLKQKRVSYAPSAEWVLLDAEEYWKETTRSNLPIRPDGQSKCHGHQRSPSPFPTAAHCVPGLETPLRKHSMLSATYPPCLSLHVPQANFDQRKGANAAPAVGIVPMAPPLLPGDCLGLPISVM